MKINLEINNLTKSPIENFPFEEIIQNTVEERANFLKGKEFSLSLAWVSEEEIKKLNSFYRKKNCSTDILSFPEFKNLDEIKSQKGDSLFLGELILCYDDIKKYVQKMNLNIKEELQKVFIHGLLHLLGMEHSKKMFELQKKLIQKNGKNKTI